MRQFVIATHGRFAEGIMDSVNLITGEHDNVLCYSAFVTEGENLTDRVNEILDSYPVTDDIIVVADLLGGSVNNEFIRQLNRPNLHVLTGMNLAMLLELFANQNESVSDMIDAALGYATTSIRYCNSLVKEMQNE